jgi:hypothetical protein
LWDELYHRAAPAQQDALLALAARQGVLYAHQIAPPENGAAHARRPLLPALLNGQIKDLQALHPPRLESLDAALDEAQRDAAARALHTTDICLIQGLPGTGKSRVVAEIVRQAAARGERALLLAPTAAALDRVLEQVGGLDGIYAVRCPASQEPVTTLPTCIRRLTVAERLRHFQEQTLPAAQHAAETARKRRDFLHEQEPAWKRLDEVVAKREYVAGQVSKLEERRRLIPDEVEREAAALGPIAAVERAGRESLEQLESRLGGLRTEAEKATNDLREADAQLARVAPVAEARRAGRWWSAAWWRGVGKGDVVARETELRKGRDDLQATSDRLSQEQTQLEAERRQVEETYRAECARLRDEETARRLADIDIQLAAARQEADQLDRQGDTVRNELGDGASLLTGVAFQTACAAWSKARTEADDELSQAKQWLAGIEAARDKLPEQIARCANLVAATTAALAGDSHFGDRSATQAPFDLLILDDAEDVTESEFVHVARHARRWVLVGEPVADAEASDSLPRRTPGGPPAGKPLRPAALRPGFFQRLWHHLHADPRRLPFAWAKRDGRLVCRLRPGPQDPRTPVECEPVADRPEIELRIASPPRQLPHLFEVVFPAAMTIREAKEYIFRELGEVTLQVRGAAARWSEEPDRIVLQLGPAQDPDAVPVSLGDGVRELLSGAVSGEDNGVPWHTCGVSFARGAGWTPERARQWVEEHVKLRDLGRTAFLGVSYRMRPALAVVVSDLLRTPADLQAHTPPAYGLNGAGLTNGSAPCLEFVAVPTSSSDAEPRRRTADPQPHWQGGATATASRVRAPRGGAGLEVDLADPRRLDPLPADLRAQLPSQGVVNYLEAQAVVRRLEELVADPQSIAAPSNLCGKHDGCHAEAHCPAIAVMAPYAAQVELLRRLIQRSAALAATAVPVEVGLPAAFRHRECEVAFVSLTRSHTHRAVTYGEHPRALVHALTRPRGRLIVFGDPGTLARRSQWQGAVDHLDETAAGLERALATELLRHSQGDGAHPSAFPFREGSRV